MNQRNRLGANRITTSNVAKAFAGFRLDAHLRRRDFEAARHSSDHERRVRCELRAFKSYGGVNVHDPIAGPADKIADAFEKNQARFPAPSRGGVRKMPSDIAKGGCAEQGVADGVDQYVAVGMSGRALLEWNPDAAHDHFTSGFKAVQVVAKTNPKT